MKVTVHNEHYNITIHSVNKAVPSLVNNGRRLSSGNSFKNVRLNDLIKAVLLGLQKNNSTESIQDAKLLLRAFRKIKDRGYEPTGKMSILNFPVSWIVRVKHFLGRIHRTYLLAKLKKIVSNAHSLKTSNKPLNTIKKVEPQLPIYSELSKKFPLPADVMGEILDRSDLKGQTKLGLVNKNYQEMLSKRLLNTHRKNFLQTAFNQIKEIKKELKLAPESTHLFGEKSLEAKYFSFLKTISKYNPEFVFSEMEQRLEEYKEIKEFRHADALIPMVRVFSVLARINPERTKQLINFEQLFREMIEFTEELFVMKEGASNDLSNQLKNIQVSALLRNFGIAYLYLGEKEKVREIAQELNCDRRIFNELDKNPISKIMIENVLNEVKWEIALVYEYTESDQLDKALETLKTEMASPKVQPLELKYFYEAVLKVIDKCNVKQKEYLAEEIIPFLETNESLNRYLDDSPLEIYLKLGKLDEAKRKINEKMNDEEYYKVKNLILLAKYSQDRNETITLLNEAEKIIGEQAYMVLDLIKIADIYSSIDKNKAIQILSQPNIAKIKDMDSNSISLFFRKEYMVLMRVWMKVNPEYLLDLFKQKKIDYQVLNCL